MTTSAIDGFSYFFEKQSGWFNLIQVEISSFNSAVIMKNAVPCGSKQGLDRFRTAFGDEAQCKTTIYNWFAEFKCGRVNFSDEFHDGRLFTAVNNKNIDAAHRTIETDRHLIYHEIRASLGIGMSQIPSSYIGV
ncbi:hypothetical protein EVAR_45608_1 [Eumeta japonica]|uniref:Mos1 transposase HTH domain-containing protein n=1 Tax=Eumeta variegata TaxID=151549 RepID=A0A4C1WHD3_EUMVA|nr:hypothetical protein EVAR_45608_1 [Eumeta japonica]